MALAFRGDFVDSAKELTETERGGPGMGVRVGLAVGTAVALLATAPYAVAHEGHGNPEWYRSVLHYIVEPAHVPLTVVMLVVSVLACRRVSNLTRCGSGRRVRAALE